MNLHSANGPSKNVPGRNRAKTLRTMFVGKRKNQSLFVPQYPASEASYATH